MMRIWLDTDIGGDVDDAVALLCALRLPEIELVGISTVMHRVEINAWVAQEMLRRAGLTDIPVLPGASAAIGVDPASIGDENSDWLPTHGRLAPPMKRLSARQDGERVDAIAEAMGAVAEPFHLVTIGPLTNIARLLSQGPGVAAKWLSTTCMAGWLDGNPEYNVQADVQAARAVIAKTAPRMVGLEVSSYTLSREETEAALDPGDPVSAFLLDCYREYRKHADWNSDTENSPLTLYDAIALLLLVRKDLFTLEEVKVALEDDGKLRRADDGAPVTYATGCDWDGLKGVLLGLLRKD